MNNKSKKTNREKIIKLTELAMLTAIEIIVCFTPLGTLSPAMDIAGSWLVILDNASSEILTPAPIVQPL